LLRKAIYIEINAEENKNGNPEGMKHLDKGLEEKQIDKKSKHKNIFFNHFIRLFTLTNKQAASCRSIAICLMSNLFWFILLVYSTIYPDTATNQFFLLVLEYFPAITWLFFIIIYLNNSTDTSSFAIKIISFSIILPLIAFSLLSITFLNKEKEHYLQFKIITLNRIKEEIRKNQIPEYPDDLDYIVKKDLGNNSSEILFSRDPVIDMVLIQEKHGTFQSISISAEKITWENIPDSPEIREYRYGFKSINNKKSIHRYLYFYNEDDKYRYEFGFNYGYYLDYMHSGTNVSHTFILITTLILLVSLTIFIRFIIQKPIITLLSGVDDVMKGNLDVSLDITNNDEIGSITQSFNSMIYSLRKSHIQLKEYSTNLEKTIEERTEKIKENAQQLKQMNIEL
jgi:methyl-accepting chemotaxis protein